MALTTEQRQACLPRPDSGAGDSAFFVLIVLADVLGVSVGDAPRRWCVVLDGGSALRLGGFAVGI